MLVLTWPIRGFNEKTGNSLTVRALCFSGIVTFVSTLICTGLLVLGETWQWKLFLVWFFCCLTYVFLLKLFFAYVLREALKRLR